MLVLDVDIVTTTNTSKVSGVRFVRFNRLVKDGGVNVARYTVLTVPSNRYFVVELRCCGLDGLKHPLLAVPLECVVRRVGLDHGFHFLGGSSGSLSDNGMLDQLVTKMVGRGVEYSFDSSYVSVEAKVP